MKSLYSTLIAIIAFVLFPALAIADPGTTWDKQINGAGRFQVLSQFGGAAVLDKETGRVWQQSPSTADFSWFLALAHCYRLEVGGRKGWRGPTIEELASLIDTSQPAPTLPAGHPFSNVQSSVYWSATTDAFNASRGWAVSFFGGGGDVFTDDKPEFRYVWCVRGGQGIDGAQ